MDGTEAVDVATHPAVILTAVIVAVVWLVVSAAAKVAGPIAEARATIRASRQQDEDARIVDLSHQVDHLAGRVWTLEQTEARQERALIAHARWDHDLISKALAAGLEVTDPPPLRPPMEAP